MTNPKREEFEREAQKVIDRLPPDMTLDSVIECMKEWIIAFSFYVDAYEMLLMINEKLTKENEILHKITDPIKKQEDDYGQAMDNWS